MYVKNFGPEFGDRDLFKLFKAFGSIKSAKVRRSKIGYFEKPLGCGFVDFENPDEAERARQALDGWILSSGRKISVTYADCKSRRLRKKLEESVTVPKSSDIIENLEITEEFSLSNDDFVISGNSLDLRNRKGSLSSNFSSESSLVATSLAVSDLWSDLWSKLLNTSNWNEYKLF